MKYRIAIQRVILGEYKHVHNIMFDTNNIKGLIKKIRKAIQPEIDLNEKKVNKR